ncbi:MAG: PAS domain-containing sensor histidine kinase, partial [Candidatus Micrarchaeaceae archaeon]
IAEIKESFYGSTEIDFGNGLRGKYIISIKKVGSKYACIVTKDFTIAINTIAESMNAIFLYSSDLMIKIDNRGVILSLNRSAEKAIGEVSQYVVGSQLVSLYKKEDEQKLFDAIASSIKHGFSSDSIVTLVTKNGEIPSVQNILKVGEDELLVVLKDLSQKRTIERLEREVQNYKKEAEKYKGESELKTQFINNISHDLKTPLTAILGFSKLMLGGEFGELKEEQKNYLKIIIDESNRLMQLIQQILDVAKLSSRTFKLDLRKVDLRELKENPSIKSLQEVAQSKGLEFIFDVDPEVPEVMVDLGRIIQVLTNLIGNAIKFTEKGYVRVNIMRKRRSVRVEVIDTGIGISKEDRSKLFKKFYQVKKNAFVKQEGSGTGLGLSIAKEIVNLHGGSIGVKSEPGKGSTFWFTIPISPKKKAKENKV